MLLSFKRLEEAGFEVRELAEGLQIVPKDHFTMPPLDLEAHGLTEGQALMVTDDLALAIQKFQIMNALKW